MIVRRSFELKYHEYANFLKLVEFSTTASSNNKQPQNYNDSATSEQPSTNLIKLGACFATKSKIDREIIKIPEAPVRRICLYPTICALAVTALNVIR
jgi:hypothetical protein